MRFLFDPESMIMQILSRACDLVILNLVFLLTCIPIFTIGAANAALYAVVSRMDTELEEKMLPTYFRAFRENFRQGTQVWLLWLLFGAGSLVNMVRFSEIGGSAGYALTVLDMLVIVLLFMVFSYAFPMMVKFRNRTTKIWQNSLLLGIANFPRSVVLVAVNCFPWALMVMNLYTFIRLGFIWLVIYFAAAAYFNSRVLKKVFDSLSQT